MSLIFVQALNESGLTVSMMFLKKKPNRLLKAFLKCYNRQDKNEAVMNMGPIEESTPFCPTRLIQPTQKAARLNSGVRRGSTPL